MLKPPSACQSAFIYQQPESTFFFLMFYCANILIPEQLSPGICSGNLFHRGVEKYPAHTPQTLPVHQAVFATIITSLAAPSVEEKGYSPALLIASRLAFKLEGWTGWALGQLLRARVNLNMAFLRKYLQGKICLLAKLSSTWWGCGVKQKYWLL